MTSFFHNDSIIKTSNDISITNGRQTMSDHNGGPAFSGLKREKFGFWIHEQLYAKIHSFNLYLLETNALDIVKPSKLYKVVSGFNKL